MGVSALVVWEDVAGVIVRYTFSKNRVMLALSQNVVFVCVIPESRLLVFCEVAQV